MAMTVEICFFPNESHINALQHFKEYGEHNGWYECRVVLDNLLSKTGILLALYKKEGKSFTLAARQEVDGTWRYHS